MAWYDEAVFYHIYPLGMTGAPKHNDYGEPVSRLKTLIPWITHIKNHGFNALYIGPLFESVGHGYETTDYKKLDSRLGTNQDLTDFVSECHKQGVKVILDGVFNHTGRDFFAFKDIKEKREASQYRDWYCNVNFGGNNEYNDGFSYENWGGYNLLVKLNQHNQAVKDYICDVIRFWVKEFDIDGIRLDAADVLDFEYMKALRRTANEVKPDFWLMGEVIHGNYSRWVNGDTLHSVTNYMLHKALYSGHNDHNYFEIAHTVKHVDQMGSGSGFKSLKLYNFVDNHDVERICTKLTKKAHFVPVHILMYTLPGVPSVYYGSEFGIEGAKQKSSDDSLRPYIDIEKYMAEAKNNSFAKLISALGKIRQQTKALSYGEYKELMLTNRQFAFSRGDVIVAVNNDDSNAAFNLPANGKYIGALSGEKLSANGGRISFSVKGNSGEIWVPADGGKTYEPVEVVIEAPAPAPVAAPAPTKVDEPVSEVKPETQPKTAEAKAEIKAAAKPERAVEIPKNKSYEEMTVEELQQCIMEKMRKNGPVTERMAQDVYENTHHGSLVTWAKSFI